MWAIKNAFYHRCFPKPLTLKRKTKKRRFKTYTDKQKLKEKSQVWRTMIPIHTSEF